MQTLEREIETLNPPEIEQSIAPSQWMQYGRAFAGLFLRDLHVLRVEDAVRRMTTLPAETFHLKDRGQLREGNWADITLFDPVTVQDNSTYSDPHHYATGIPFVLVNGVEVVKDGQHTGAKPGMALRHVAPIQPERQVEATKE